MRDIGIRLVVDDTQKAKFGAISAAATAANRALQDVQARYSNPLAQYDYALNRLGASAASLGRTMFASVTAGAAGLTAALGGLGKSLIEVNERFTNLQISMGSALRSMQSAKMVVGEVMKYTARSSLPYEAIANAANVMAASPQMSGLLQKQLNTGQIGNQQGTMQRYLDLINAMQVYRPDRTPDQAIFAVRSFMGGNTRSMNRVYNMSPDTISQISGASRTQMDQDFGVRLDALSKVFGNIISRDALVAISRQPKSLRQNYVEQGLDIPMKMLGEGAEGSSNQPYNKITIRFQKIFDSLTEFVSTTFEEKFAPRLRDAITTTFDKLFTSGGSIATKALDALGVAGSGLSFERFYEAVTMIIEKTTNFITEMIALIDKHDLVNVVGKFISTISKTVGALVKFFVVDLEEKLGKFTFSGVGIASLAAFPAVLANIGTIIRATSNLPKTYGNIWSFITGSRLGKEPITAEALVGSRLLQGSARGTNPFDFPRWMSGQRFEGADREAYTQSFMNNPALAGKLEEDLRYTSGRARNLKAYNTIRSSYLADKAYLNDPKNSKVIEALVMAGRGGGAMTGIASGAAEEARRLRDVPSVGSRMMSGAKTLGYAALGAAGGILVTGVASAALTVVGTGLYKVYDALTSNSIAIKENTERLALSQEEYLSRILNSSEIKQGAKLLEKSPSDLVSADVLSRRSVIDNLLESALPRIKALSGNLAPTGLQKALTSIGTMDEFGGTINTRAAAEDQVALAEAAIKGAGLSDLPAILKELGNITAGKNVDIAGILQQWNSGDHLAAANAFIAQLKQVPGGLTSVASQLSDARRDIENIPAKMLQAQINAKFGDGFGTLIGQVNAGSADGGNVDELFAKILALKGNSTGNSIEYLRGLSSQTMQLNSHPLAAKMLERLDSDMEKLFPGKSIADELTNLYETQAAMQDSLKHVISNFDANREEALAAVDTYLKSDSTSEFAKTLMKIKADPTALDSIRRELEAAISKASDNGAALVTSVMSVYSTISDMMKSGARLTDASIEDYATNLNPVLAKVGLDYNFSTEGLSKHGSKKDMAGRALSIEDQMLGALNKALDRIGTTTPGSELEGPQKLIFRLIDDIQSQKDSAEKTYGNASMIDAVKKIRASSAANMLSLDKEIKGVDTNIDFLSRLTDSRVLAKSRFAQTNKAASTSSGGALNDSVDSKMREFALSLGYSEGGTKEAVMSGLLPNTRGFSKDTSLSNAMAIRKKIMELATLSPEQAAANIAITAQNDKLIHDPKVDETTRTNAMRDNNAIQDRENELKLVRNKAEEDYNALLEQQTELQVRASKEGFFGGLKEGLSSAKESLMDFLSAGKTVGDGIKQSFTDAFTSLVQGTQTGKEAFRSFVGSVTDMLVKMMMQKAVQMLFNFFLSAFAPAPVADSTGGYGALDVRAGATGGRVGMDRIGANAILHMARGGAITRGSGVRDDVPAMLMQGEYVIKKATAERIGYHNLDAINNDRLPHYAGGGMVGGSSVGGGHYGPSQRVVNITINVTNEGGQPKSRMDTDAQTEQMRTIADSIDALVEEKLLEHSRSRGFFKTV